MELKLLGDVLMISKLHSEMKALFKEVGNLIKLSNAPHLCCILAEQYCSSLHFSLPEYMVMHSYDTKRLTPLALIHLHGDIFLQSGMLRVA